MKPNLFLYEGVRQTSKQYVCQSQADCPLSTVGTCPGAPELPSIYSAASDCDD